MTQKGLEKRDWTGRPLERSEIRRTARKASERAQNGLGGAAGQPRSVWKRAGARKRAGPRKRLEELKSSLKGGERLGRARATWKGPAGRPGRAGLGQVGSGSARLGPVVYSGADVLPVVYQWFTSGLLQWFTRVLIVFGGTLEIFLKEQFDIQIWCS